MKHFLWYRYRYKAPLPVLVLMFLCSICSAEISAGDSNFSRVDREVDGLPAAQTRTLDGLARALAGVSSNDADRARAIYRWIRKNVTYDTAGLRAIEQGSVDIWQSIRSPEQAAEEALKRRTGVCAHFSFLYSALGRRMGLPVKNVYGWHLPYAKKNPAGYARIYKGRPDHLWNAVMVDGSWRLIDAVTGDFLTGPAFMIRTHYPENPYWQLLDAPVKRDIDRGAALVLPAMKKHGLKLLQPREYLLFTGGAVTIVLEAVKPITLYGTIVRDNDPDDHTAASVHWKGNRAEIVYDFSRESPEKTCSFVVSALSATGKPEILVMVKVIRMH